MVIASSLFQWLMSLCTNKLAFLTVRDLRADAFAKLERVPLKYIDKSTKGELTSRVINDIEIISDGLLQGFTQFFSGIITIIGTLIFMMFINFKIAVVVVLLTPLSFLAASKITKATHNSYSKSAEIDFSHTYTAVNGFADKYRNCKGQRNSGSRKYKCKDEKNYIWLCIRKNPY